MVLQISDISVTNVQEQNFGFTVTANKIPVAVTVHPRKFTRNLIFLYLNRCVSFSNTGIFRFQLIFVCLIKQTARRKTYMEPTWKEKYFPNRYFLSSMFILEVVPFFFSHAKCWWRFRKLSDWQMAMVLFQSIQEVELAPSIVSDLELKLTKMFMGI